MSYLSTDEAYDYDTLACWYQRSIDETQPPIWTDEHLEELLKDFYIIPKDTPTADVVPKSEVVVEVIDALFKDLYFKTTEDLEHIMYILLERANKLKTQTEFVHCKDCKYLVFSDCYGECAKAHKGIVQPDDSCEYGEKKYTE